MVTNDVSGIYGVEDLKNGWNTSNTEGFSGLGKEKVASLKELTTEIESLIGEREKMSSELIKEADKMKLEIKNFLLENAPKGEDDSEFARERAELRKKQMEISELQLNEKVGCWRDVALLKKELRERQRELSEKESRMQMLNEILEVKA
jgi:nitrate/TMAO reductase-like tetraheme cytochrome c subunit